VSIKPPTVDHQQGRCPQGLPEQTSLMGALAAAVRESGGSSHAKLITGSQAPKAKRRQQATLQILADFIRPRKAEGQDN